MGETTLCFMCGLALRKGVECTVIVRTGVPKWEKVNVCAPCVIRVKQREAQMLCHDGEWYTVRAEECDPVLPLREKAV